MLSFAEFNSKKGAKELINDPRAIRGKSYDFLKLKGGTVKDRLQQAVDENDPRLFGIAMHEYQDTFAHAGFKYWHGTSHDNDYYCEEGDISSECISSIGETDDYNKIKEQLYERDRLMEEGTQYWMRKYMSSQAQYNYDLEKINALTLSGKEEKILKDGDKNASEILKATENENDYYWIKNGGGLGLGVFAEQGIISGDLLSLPTTPFCNDNQNAIWRSEASKEDVGLQGWVETLCSGLKIANN